jgi:uncharacterized membrane protein YhaH (DUF805 family)
MSPIDWAKRPLTKYADLSGRASRAEFWWFFLAVIVAALVAQIIDSILGIQIIGPYGIFYCLVMLGAIVPNITVAVRRLHDTNRSGWWLSLPIVPYALAFAFGGAALMRAATGGAAGMTAGPGMAGIFLLIGAVGAVVLLIFYILPGTPGDNRYGPDPYAAGGASAATA